VRVAEASPTFVGRGSVLESPSAAPWLLLGSALSFGVMAFLSKLATEHYDGASLSVSRFTFGLLVMLAMRAGGAITFAPQRKGLLILRGVLGGVSVLLWYLSMEHLGAGMATLLNYTSPIFALVFSKVFLKEALTGRALASMAVAATGVLLVVEGQSAVTTGPPAAPEWIAVALLSALISGGAVTTIRALRTGDHPDSPWTIFTFFCAGAVAVASPLVERFRAPTMVDAVILVAVGMTAMAGQLTMNFAMRNVSAPTHGITSQLGVVVAGGLSYVWLGEEWSLLSLAGAMLTVSGAVVAAFSPVRR